MAANTEAKAMAIAAGNRLKWVRELTGKSQKQIAVLIGINPERWSRWENASRNHPPPPEEMAAICRRLRISMDYIYRGLLIGVHPDLADELFKRHPEELVLPPTHTGWSMDRDQP